MTVTGMTMLDKIDAISSMLFTAWETLEKGESFGKEEMARGIVRLAAEDLYALSQDVHKKLMEQKEPADDMTKEM